MITKLLCEKQNTEHSSRSSSVSTPKEFLNDVQNGLKIPYTVVTTVTVA